MLENIGGEHVKAVGMMGAGVDPHLYRATPSDMSLFQKADIIFYNGMHLEGRLADILVRYARRKPTFAVTEGLQAAEDPRLREPEEFAGHFDPHIWHDASLWSECVRYAAKQLQAFDPPHADQYAANAEAYIAQLKSEHERIKLRLAAIPSQRRVLVTAHDAFGYFGQAYDIEVRALQGISTVSEADLGTVQELIDMLVDRKIKAVFIESSVPRRNIDSLIEGCQDRGHGVKVGGELFSDAMGQAGTPEDTYLGMMRHNVETIVRALE
jgi:manganese/zinc/iron transport system substrate-binding protein